MILVVPCSTRDDVIGRNDGTVREPMGDTYLRPHDDFCSYSHIFRPTRAVVPGKRGENGWLVLHMYDAMRIPVQAALGSVYIWGPLHRLRVECPPSWPR